MSNKPITFNDGHFVEATDGTGLTSLNANSLTSGTISTAQLPIIPTSKGGFGVDVSSGLTNGDVAQVVGGTVVFASPPAAAPTGSASGDLSGTYPGPTVAKIRNRTVSATAPAVGQFYSWDGSQWVVTTPPTSLPPSGPAGGDLLNNYPNPSVVKIQGTSVSNIAPIADQFLQYNFVNARWEPTTVSSLPPSGSAGGDLSL